MTSKTREPCLTSSALVYISMICSDGLSEQKTRPLVLRSIILVNLCSFFYITVKSFLFSNLRVLRALCSILIVSYLFDFSHLGFIDTVNVALLHTRFVLLRFRQWSSSHWAEDQFFCDGPLDLSRNKLDLSQDVSKVFNQHTFNV